MKVINKYEKIQTLRMRHGITLTIIIVFMLIQFTQSALSAEAMDNKFVNEFISVSAGRYHTLAVKTDGSLWAWGYNLRGQLGNGETSRIPNTFPVKIMDDAFAVSASVEHSMAVKTDGSLWTWGRNIITNANSRQTIKDMIY